MATIKLRKPTEEEKDKIKSAAKRGELETLIELTYTGVDVRGIVDQLNKTALHLAAWEGHYNIVTFLCGQEGIVDNVDDLRYRRTPLHYAAWQGHTDCVALLIKSRANVNMKDNWQRTPLHYAAEGGHTDCVTLLMSRANVHMRDVYGYNPQQLAMMNSHHKTVEFFIKQEIYITQFDMYTQHEQIMGDNQPGLHDIQQVPTAQLFRHQEGKEVSHQLSYGVKQESIDDDPESKTDAKDVIEYEKKFSAKVVEINQLNNRVTEFTIKEKELKIENQKLKKAIEKMRGSLKEYQDKKLETEIGKLKVENENPRKEIEQLGKSSKFKDSVHSRDVSISNEILKHGSYYVTKEAQYCGKQCIAKMEHLNKDNSSMLLNKERNILLLLKHPFIVQLLATYGNPQSPVLLMERMWMSLTEFLTNKQLHHNKINILHDAACGLHYIHERGIIHCNLTTDNIMLTENVTAKLADFGQANFCQQNVKYSAESLDHLPPEMICEPYSGTIFSTKVDVFSFGCVIIHTFTQEFPTPDFDKYVETSEVGKYIRHSEVERRSICLKKFKNNCKSIKLYDTVLKCLQDNPDNRPAAETLPLLLEKQMITGVPDSFKNGEDVYPQVSFKSEIVRANIATQLIEQLRLLTTLNVSGCNITDQGADMIAAVLLEMVSLTKLDLSNTMINSVKATKIVSALKNISSLKVFNINNNDIDDGAADSIAVAISSNSLLEKINLSHNKLFYTGILNIVKALPENIRAVDISNNLIAQNNIGDLATVLSKWPLLQELNISRNLLNFTNVLTIAEVFRYHPTLETLDMSSNNISFSSACEFIVDVILSVNQTLVNLNVCGRNIRPRFMEGYLSPHSSKNNSTEFMLQSLYSLQRSSLDINTKFIKVTEVCPIYSDDIISYYVDHLGSIFYNRYHNFVIIIPPGAVTQGDCVEIQGTANYNCPYTIPNGFYPISSHYWVSANYEFKVPVYFIMNHYAKIRSLEDINNLYVLHKCAQDVNATNDLTLATISNGVYFDNQIGYCVLATNHFCSYCQAKNVEHIPEYLTACYCTYDESTSGSHIAEVSFCPSSSECRKVITEQCEKRKAKLQHSETFDITDGDEVFISSIDKSNVNKHEWILSQRGKLTIAHLGDFKYWRIFHGLTVEQIREREELCEYPPRLQIKCKPFDAAKSLYFSFTVSKRSKNRDIPIAQFLLDKILADKPQTLQGVSQLPQGLPQPKSGEYTTMTTEEMLAQTTMQRDKQHLKVVLPATSKHKIFLIKPLMHHLNRIVVPKVSAEWEDIAYALQYDIPTVEQISGKHNDNPIKCCKELFKNWLATDNGAKPKIWQTLLDRLKEVENLQSGTDDIIKKLSEIDSQV